MASGRLEQEHTSTPERESIKKPHPKEQLTKYLENKSTDGFEFVAPDHTASLEEITVLSSLKLYNFEIKI